MISERILVVDDEPDILEVCTRVLTEEGYQVHVAGGGRAALACLEERTFDLLLTDVKMPDVDGLAVLRQARGLDPDMTAVIITGYSTLQNAINALRAGARGFLLKPFDLDELLSTVKEALEERRQERENLLLRARLPILEIGQTLMVEGDAVHLAGRLLESVARQIDADRASIMLLDETTEELTVAGVVGLPAEVVGTTRVLVDFWRGLLLREEPLVLGGERDRDPSLQALMGGPDVVCVCVPLRARKRALGLLNVSRLPGGAPFTASDLNLLSIVGRQIATALDNARLYETVAQGKREREATFDAITDGISIHDGEFNIVRANQALARTLNVPLERLIGQKCYRVFQCEETSLEWCPHRQMLEDGAVHTAELDDSRLGGTFLISAYPLLNAQGEIGASVHGDEGQPIWVGDETNVQDGVVLHALETWDHGAPVEKNLVTVDGKKYAVYVGDRVSLAHQAQIHGPAKVGDDTFIGMQALVFKAEVGANCVVEPKALLLGVKVVDGRYVPAGSLITSQEQADALPLITDDYLFKHLNEGVVHVNTHLADGYNARGQQQEVAAFCPFDEPARPPWATPFLPVHVRLGRRLWRPNGHEGYEQSRKVGGGQRLYHHFRADLRPAWPLHNEGKREAACGPFPLISRNEEVKHEC